MKRMLCAIVTFLVLYKESANTENSLNINRNEEIFARSKRFWNSAPKKKFQVSVQTSGDKNAGTNANIYFVYRMGKDEKTKDKKLDKWLKNDFEKGSIGNYVVSVKDKGKLKMWGFKMGSFYYKSGFTWKFQEAYLKDMSTNKVYKCKHKNVWVAKKKYNNRFVTCL